MMLKMQRLTQNCGAFWDIRGVTACIVFPLHSINRSAIQIRNLVESSLETGSGIRFLYS